MNPRTRTVMVIAALCAVIGALALACTVAQGADRHNYVSQFGEVPAVGPHGETVPVPGPGIKSIAMTIDSGEVYLVDDLFQEIGRPIYRINKFNAATGAFVSQFPRLPGPASYGFEGVAVGHAGAETDVYVAAVESQEGASAHTILVFDQAGALRKVWRGSETLSKGFSCCANANVAVDDSSAIGDWAAGDVYVPDPGNNVVDVYEPETGAGEKKPVAELKNVSPSEPLSAPYEVAVSSVNGEVAVADGNGLHLFRPSAIPGQYELLATLTRPDGSPVGGQLQLTASDGEGDFYALSGSDGKIFEFNAAGEDEGQITSETTPTHLWGKDESAQPATLGSDPETHELYVGTYDDNEPAPVLVFGPNIVLPDVATAAASNVKPLSATLNGTVDLDKGGSATCQFEWGSSSALGEVAPCSGRVEAEGKVPVSVNLGHLQPGTTYFYRLQAVNANGTNDESKLQQFTTLGPLLVEASASEVASTSATLNTTVDPDGDSTSYYFQYGLSTEYGAQIPTGPGAPLGAGTSEVSVSNHIQHLIPGVVYHYRVVMISEVEVEPSVVERLEFPGQDDTFTTQIAGSGLVLPDGRQWELVSPTDKHGALIGATGNALLKASATGDAITYNASVPTEDEVMGDSNGIGIQVFSGRGATGWSSHDIMLPHVRPTGPGVSTGGEYKFFSEDLSLGLAVPFGGYTSLGEEASPPDTESTLYLRHDETCATVSTGCYEPLVTGAPGYADVPAGTQFGGKVAFEGSTPDLAHVVLGSNVALLPAATNVSSVSGHTDLFEWSATASPSDRLQLISILPQSEGGQPTGGALGASTSNTRGAISNDGSRIIWKGATEGHGNQALYLRDLARQETIRLDAAQGGIGTGTPEAQLTFANSDASRVFFTDVKALTKDSGAGGSRSDLYECEVIEGASGLTCALHDLTPGIGGRSASVQGGLLGGSEDGSTLYFVARGVLTDVPSSQGEKPVEGADNLYRLHYDSGSGKWEAPSLVAVLSHEDEPDWSTTLSRQTTRVSSDGRYLEFMSDRPVTGYDSHDASSGKADEEVFLFDARANRLVCASCDPTGALPHGVEANPTGLGRLVDGGSTWEATRWLAANVPGWNTYNSSTADYQSRYLSDDGRLFFNSSDALVPQDINGTEDVYEYEPAGIGGCATSTPTFSERSEGCVSLISSGTSSAESAFLDASEAGNDVFFLTAEPLLPQDVDTLDDVYDAHVCSSSAPCYDIPVSAPACVTADACRAAPSPQPATFGAPASATFAGAGNVTPSTPTSAVRAKTVTKARQLVSALAACDKRYRSHRSKRKACERQAKKRYGGKASRKAKATKKRGGK